MREMGADPETLQLTHRRSSAEGTCCHSPLDVGDASEPQARVAVFEELAHYCYVQPTVRRPLSTRMWATAGVSVAWTGLTPRSIHDPSLWAPPTLREAMPQLGRPASAEAPLTD